MEKTNTTGRALCSTIIYAAIQLLWIVLAFVLLPTSTVFSRAGALGAVAACILIVVTSLLFFLFCRREYRALASMRRERQRDAEWLRAVADTSTDLVSIKDTEGRYLMVNGATEQLVGRTAADMVGRTDAELFGAAAAGEILASDGQAMATGAVVRHEAWMSWPAGATARHFEVTTGPLRDSSQRTTGVFAIMRDTTAEKLRAQEWRQTNELFRASFAQMSNGFVHARIVVMNGRPSDYVCTAVNDAFARLVGVEAPAGRRLFDLLPGLAENDPELVKALARVATTGAAEQRELYLRTVNAWLALNIARPVSDHLVLVFEVITARKQQEERVGHLNGLLHSLRDIGQTILHEYDDRRLLSEVCRILQQNRGYVTVWMGRPDQVRGVVQMVAYAGRTAASQVQETITWDESPNGRGPTDTAIRERRTVTVDDVANDPSFAPWRESVLASGARSIAAVPLLWHEEVMAVLVVKAERAFAFDEDELGLLRTLADDFARALRGIEDRRQREESERRLRLADSALAAVANGVLITDVRGAILWANEAMSQITGYSAAELLGQRTGIFNSGAQGPEVYETMWSTIMAGSVWRGELVNRRKDGTLFHEELAISPVQQDGVITQFVAIVQDISDRVQLRNQLLQAQKMETIGQLAGGVAHDFNNLLQAMLGHVEILFGKTSAGDERRHALMEVQKAGHRAAELTRQLLALGRKQVLAPRVTDLNGLVEDMVGMLQRVLGPDTRVVTELAPDLPSVTVDHVQISQILLNLAVNARDAMPTGGRLSIQTSAWNFAASDLAFQPGVAPGLYACVAVTDTGMGMTAEVKARLFEPFFTTKGAKDSGLGLATSYGIARQHNGWINVYSEVGLGSCFRLYLPALPAVPLPADVPVLSRPAVPPRGRGQRILVVEDTEVVLAMVRRQLEMAGYVVIEASDAATALKHFEETTVAFDLLLIDAVLPDMNGLDLADQLLAQCPDLRVVISSGYTDNERRWPMLKERGWPFIAKPYTMAELLAMVARVLSTG